MYWVKAAAQYDSPVTNIPSSSQGHEECIIILNVRWKLLNLGNNKYNPTKAKITKPTETRLILDLFDFFIGKYLLQSFFLPLTDKKYD
jgi:hypothetical protein